MVYRRALHPELLDLRGRRLHRHAGYEVECWVAPAGHVVRFQYDGDVITETVVEDGDHLPELGLVHALPCIGEKEYELEADEEHPTKLGYVTTLQTEVLTDNLYSATLLEMQDFARERNALCHEWNDEGGARNLSLLDVQKFRREFHLQGYHMMGGISMVLRTQSIFEIL